MNPNLRKRISNCAYNSTSFYAKNKILQIRNNQIILYTVMLRTNVVIRELAFSLQDYNAQNCSTVRSQ